MFLLSYKSYIDPLKQYTNEELFHWIYNKDITRTFQSIEIPNLRTESTRKVNLLLNVDWYSAFFKRRLIYNIKSTYIHAAVNTCSVIGNRLSCFTKRRTNIEHVKQSNYRKNQVQRRNKLVVQTYTGNVYAIVLKWEIHWLQEQRTL